MKRLKFRSFFKLKLNHTCVFEKRAILSVRFMMANLAVTFLTHHHGESPKFHAFPSSVTMNDKVT